MQFFVKPGTDDEWFERWKAARMEWHLANGIRKEKLRYHEHGPDELAHYAKDAGGCADVEYAFPFSGEKGFSELEEVAYIEMAELAAIEAEDAFDFTTIQESDRRVVRLKLDGEKVVREERLLKNALGRIRDVRMGPDGFIYLLTDEPNGVLARVELAE